MAKIEGYLNLYVFIDKKNSFVKAGTVSTIYAIKDSIPILGF